jgi:hypothetical protein
MTSSSCDNFRVHAAVFDNTVRGALSSPHSLKLLGLATKGHTHDRDMKVVLGKPHNKRHIWYTVAYSGRSAEVAAISESQAAPPT